MFQKENKMKYIIPFILLWMSHISTAQNPEVRATEWSLRTGTSVDYKFNKKWKTDLNWESRFNDNISAYDESLIQWGVSYRTRWDIKLQSSFRHYLTPDQLDSYRLSWGMGYGEFIKDSPLKISMLLRYQRDNVYKKTERDVEPGWRLKVSFVYEAFKNLVFVLEDELFYEQQGESEWDKNRVTTGIEWAINEQMELVGFYRFENELSATLADFDHTLGIYLAFKMEQQKEEDAKRARHFGHPYPW